MHTTEILFVLTVRGPIHVSREVIHARRQARHAVFDDLATISEGTQIEEVMLDPRQVHVMSVIHQTMWPEWPAFGTYDVPVVETFKYFALERYLHDFAARYADLVGCAPKHLYGYMHPIIGETMHRVAGVNAVPNGFDNYTGIGWLSHGDLDGRVVSSLWQGCSGDVAETIYRLQKSNKLRDIVTPVLPILLPRI